MKNILIVDDEPAARRLLYHALKSDHHVLEAGTSAEALAAVRSDAVDLVLLDMHLAPNPGTADEGIRLHAAIRSASPWLPVVITTGDEDRSLALDMVRQGVADFLLKPIDPTVLKIVVARALDRADLERELRDLREQVRARCSFGSLIGQSPSMRKVFSHLERLAPVPTTVLLTGESGTGKSAVACALHHESPRKDKPFVVVDGAVIPETLLESTMFGHDRGAYTGADAPRTGRIKMADGGTLFLDEIGNLSPAAQSKLLLFLDTRSYTPVGSNQEVRVDVRLVAATNRDLGRMVAEGRFREDLLYRLQVASVTLPPLRERRECIAPLADYFLVALARELGRERQRMTPAALALLETYPWPGNVRQLRHVLESSLVLATGGMLDDRDLILPAVSVSPVGLQGAEAATSGEPLATRTLKASVSAYEGELLRRALMSCHGNKAAAGRMLGLDENQVRYLCRKHEID